MNSLDDMSEIDEVELERQLEGMQLEGSYLYNDSSLFADERPDITPEGKHEQSNAAMERSKPQSSRHLYKQSEQESIVVAEAKPVVVVKQTVSSRAKSKQPAKVRTSEVQKQLKRVPSQQSVDPMRLVERSLEWAEQRKSKLLSNQRQRHRNETKECSFRPRVNTIMSSAKQYNNISNISSHSTGRSTKPTNDENANPTHNASSAQVSRGKPLIEKWKEQVQQQSDMLKAKLEGVRPAPSFHRPQYNRVPHPMRNIRANPINPLPDSQRSLSKSSQTSRNQNTQYQQIQEYMRLVRLADSLFSELKTLKESNRSLMARLRPSKQLR